MQTRYFAQETSPAALFIDPGGAADDESEDDGDPIPVSFSVGDAKITTPVGDIEEIEEWRRVPAAWRDASTWVDLELERAGLDADGVKGVLDSPWGHEEGLEQPDSNVLWPHQALDEHRSRPFAMPSKLSLDDAEIREKANKQLKENRERLAALWQISASHGISWDALDHAYVQFARAGKNRYDRWSRPGKDGIEAVHQKEKAKRTAGMFLQRFCGKGKNPSIEYPSKFKRLSARIYTKAKKDWLRRYSPGRLSADLQQLVAARMCRRETQERALGFAALDTAVAPVGAKQSQQDSSTNEPQEKGDRVKRKPRSRSASA